MIELETLSAYDWTLWIAGLFALLELCRWIYSMKEFVFEKLGIKTKGMLKREEYANRLKQVENSIEEIKNTYKKNVETSIEHERQVVDKARNIIYCGSILQYAFDEVNVEKSVTVFDLDKRGVTELHTVPLTKGKRLAKISACSVEDAIQLLNN